jgi:molybdate transport system substrate-binding protein
VKPVLAFLCVALVAVACSSSPAHGRQGGSGVTVLAASSLTDPFDRIAGEFGKRAGTRVRVSYGPSDGLAREIQNGAPADVFASASERWMDAVADSPGVSDRTDFARNRLTVVVPASNPAHIRSVRDLARPGVKLVLAAVGVPAGDYGREMLRRAGIAAPALRNVVSNEVDVKSVLAKVVSGDADAGIVYVTDVTPDVASRVHAIRVPARDQVVATYAIGVVRGAADPSLATRFVRFVLGPGQAVLRRDGFLPA